MNKNSKDFTVTFCLPQHQKNKSVVALIPKLREAFAKNFQATSPLVPLATGSDIATGCLRNYDINNKEIWSQNTVESAERSGGDDDEDDDEDAMDVDDETIGNLNENREEPVGTFRSRSTIL